MGYTKSLTVDRSVFARAPLFLQRVLQKNSQQGRLSATNDPQGTDTLKLTKTHTRLIKIRYKIYWGFPKVRGVIAGKAGESKPFQNSSAGSGIGGGEPHQCI